MSVVNISLSTPLDWAIPIYGHLMPALVCITASNSKESNKTEPDTLTFQAGAPIIISSEGVYSVIECSDGEIVISKVAD